MTNVLEESPVEISRIIKATLAEIWTAWTDPDVVAEWFGPGSMSAEVLKLDVHEGGEYRIRVRGDGGTHTVGGQFVQVLTERQLIMTWAWEEADEGESQVSVTFAARDDGTEVRIVHTGLRDAQRQQSHLVGWQGSVEKLIARFNQDAD